MVYCTCGKGIEKVPDWMQSVNVEFVCNNCPNRHTKNIVFADFQAALPTETKIAEPEDLEHFEGEES